MRKARRREFSCFCEAKCEPFGEQKKTREVSAANDERPNNFLEDKMYYTPGYVYELMEKGGPTDVREPYFKEAVSEMMRKSRERRFI